MFYPIIKLKNTLKTALWKHKYVYTICARIYHKYQKYYYCLHDQLHRNVEELEDSIFQDPVELEMCSCYPKQVLDAVWDAYQPVSVLDVGCGTGVSLEYFARKGADVLGLEGSTLAISKSGIKDRIRTHNLHDTIDLQRQFELVWSYEVVEHIKPEYADILVQTLIRHAAKTLILSAAPPGQQGIGHFNEQPPEYWVEKFEQQGLRCQQERTQKLRLLKEGKNMLVFEREQNIPAAPAKGV